MDIIRAPRRSHFTLIPNDTARDRRLRRACRGLLLEMLSYPDGWVMTSDALAAAGVEGRDAVRGMLRDLELYGYLVRDKAQNEHGHWVTTTTVYDVPQTRAGLPPADPERPSSDGSTDAWKSVSGLTSGNVASSQVNPGTENQASVDQALRVEEGLRRGGAPANDPPPAAPVVVLPDTPPLNRCSAHHGTAFSGPCGACGDARRTFDAWTATHGKGSTGKPAAYVPTPMCTEHPSEPAGRCARCAHEGVRSPGLRALVDAATGRKVST